MVIFLISSTLLSALAYGAYSRAGIHWLVSITLLILLALPLTLALPKVTIEVSSITEPMAHNQWLILPIIVSAAITLLLLSKELLGHMTLRKMIHTSTALKSVPEIGHVTELLKLKSLPNIQLSESVSSPCMAGIFRPVLLLPPSCQDWTQDTWRCVLLHELSHFRRNDLFRLFVGRVASALYWFNPFVWKLRNELQMQCEYACDNAVVSTGISAKNYVSILCDLAQSHHTPHRLAFAQKNTLTSRVLHLKDNQSQRKNHLVMAIFLLSFSGICLCNVIALTPVFQELTDTELRLTADPFPADK